MKNPLGITIFGITNIIIGLVNLFVLFIPFLLVFFGAEGASSEFCGFIDWFFSVILGMLSWIVIYISSLFLFWSGISMLKMKNYARKLAILSSSGIISSIFIWILSPIITSIIYHRSDLNIDLLGHIIIFSFSLYTILLIVYLMNPQVKKQFNDENVKLPFVKLIFIILSLLIIPLIWSPNR